MSFSVASDKRFSKIVFSIIIDLPVDRVVHRAETEGSASWFIDIESWLSNQKVIDLRIVCELIREQLELSTS